MLDSDKSLVRPSSASEDGGAATNNPECGGDRTGGDDGFEPRLFAFIDWVISAKLATPIPGDLAVSVRAPSNRARHVSEVRGNLRPQKRDTI